MSPKVPTKTVDKNLYKNYITKAEQFLYMMQEALLHKKWNAVGLNAVHAVISINDAICVYYSGQKSIGEKHGDTVVLLLTIFADEEAKKISNHLSWLISRKSLVEYEARLFFETEAYEAAKHAERFIVWAKNKLPT